MNLTPRQKDLVARALEEGLKRSAERLGKITGRPWSVASTVLSDGPAERFRSVMGGSVQPHYGAYLPMQDRSPLAVLVILPAGSARSLAEALTSGYGTWVGEVQDLEEKALGEIANILAHALAGALADILGTMFILASPSMDRGTKLALLDAALARFQPGERLLMVSQLRLAAGDARGECSLAVLAERALLARLLEAARA